MMRSTSSRVRPPPNPSAMSARPSKWSAPVRSMPVSTINGAASAGGIARCTTQRTTTFARPNPAPTTGKSDVDRQIASGAYGARGTGMRVRNPTALKNDAASDITVTTRLRPENLTEDPENQTEDPNPTDC